MRSRKVLLVIAGAIVFALAASTNAFADHSPTFYVEWNQTAIFNGYGTTTFGNQGSGSPHQGYLEGTEKCGVCHSVHRAPVPGESWATSGWAGAPGAQTRVNPSARTKVAGGKYNRAEWISDSSDTQMLLLDSVTNACSFCHVYTSIGNKQLFAGDATLITSDWQEGYAHGNACTGCHAVHGVSQNYGDPTLYGQFGTFKGPIATKILKTRAKGPGGAGNQAYVWQDEVITAGSAGKTEATTLYGLVWANKLVVNDAAVDPLNVPLFPTATDAINGTNTRPGVDVADAQVSAFCTFCHQNYGYASEAVVNPDGDRSLFQGPWYALAGTVANVSGPAGTWQTMNGANANTAPFKNHPMRDGTALPFVAAGKSASVPAQVAFADSDTCRTCHDAGLENSTGVIVQSWPHFTPGYFHFTKSAAYMGAPMTYAPPIPDQLSPLDSVGIASVQAWLHDPTNYAKALTVADGQCLKCHVNATNDAGVGKTF